MTRILHIANFNSLRLKGCFQCGFPVKISTGLIKNGYEVINYPDRDLCRMFGFGHMNALGRYRLNKHLLKFCDSVRPDAILLGHADTIYNETIAAIRKKYPNIRVMQWNCDPIMPFNKHNLDAINNRLDVVDATMISTGDAKMLAQFKKDGKPVAHIPNMVDHAVETGKTFLKEELPYDVFLCANTGNRDFCGKNKDIDEILNESEEKIPDIKWLLGGLRNNPGFHGADYLDAFSKAGMGFNLSRHNHVYLYSSDRIAHMMGNGQMALLDRGTGFNEIIPEDAAAYYTTEEEFYDKLTFYKKNPQERMKVAQKGYEVYNQEFNNVIVTDFMAKILFDKPIKNKRLWQIIV